ncbi:NAD(+) kinase [Candidatus Cyanaurora vandensis]|uniref:NAD(+) kinase n=1 Tax=Candidatus Cyanaurora vandensis TaxID=2714958 RepID=UPI00257E4B13|nr:NAD(+) kinase [Candidatus Cyanaurora vandensis]
MGITKVGIIYNDTKSSALRAVKDLTELLETHHCQVHLTTGRNGILGFPNRTGPVCYTPINQVNAAGFDEEMGFAIVLGGDGTVLAAARQLAPKGIPQLNINTGHMGFLTETYLGQAHQAVEQVLAGEFRCEERSMLEVYVLRKQERVWEALVLNEAVVHKEPFTGMCHFEVKIGLHHLVDIAADGLIIATPTGSTAYALSAGGPVITPEVQVFQVVPICPHSLGARGLVYADSEPLILYPPSNHEHVILSTDGSSGCFVLPTDHIEISRSPYRTQIIRLKAPEFFEMLREKLGWGLPHIAKPESVELP